MKSMKGHWNISVVAHVLFHSSMLSQFNHLFALQTNMPILTKISTVEWHINCSYLMSEYLQ